MSPCRLAWRFGLPKNTLLDLNSHYVNRTIQPITGEVYTNLHFADPSEVEHEAHFFSLNNLDISLPAGEVTTIERDFTFSERTHIVQLLSHAHQLMVEFRVEMIGGAHDGELIYVAYDWEHPPILRFDSPLVLERGEGFRLEATYDNTTDEEVNFGLLSTDEMMILFGIFLRVGGGFKPPPTPFFFGLLQRLIHVRLHGEGQRRFNVPDRLGHFLTNQVQLAHLFDAPSRTG